MMSVSAANLRWLKIFCCPFPHKCPSIEHITCCLDLFYEALLNKSSLLNKPELVACFLALALAVRGVLCFITSLFTGMYGPSVYTLYPCGYSL